MYALAQRIKFARQDEFPDVQLLVESGVYASNSIDRTLEGKQFHRVMRALTLCYEALLYLMYENFLEWLLENNEDIFIALKTSFSVFCESYNKKICSKETLDKFLKDSEYALITLFNEFRNLRRSQSLTFKFWDECLQFIQLILQLSRAKRENNWFLAKSAQAAMLPFFLFVTSKIIHDGALFMYLK